MVNNGVFAAFPQEIIVLHILEDTKRHVVTLRILVLAEYNHDDLKGSRTGLVDGSLLDSPSDKRGGHGVIGAGKALTVRYNSFR